MISLESSFLFISFLITIGIFQSVLENFILFLKFPAILNYPLDKGVMKSNLAKKLKVLYNAPVIKVLFILQFILSLSFIISLSIGKVHFIMPLSLLFIDVIGFFRWKYLPNSHIPIQRVILCGLIFHYYFDSSEISNIVMIAFTAFLSLAYFASGYKKLLSSRWTDGGLMLNFAIESSLPLSHQKGLWKWLGYLVIFFECSFVLSIFNDKLAIIYLIVGFVFHFYLYVKHQFSFFFWTFVAAYPAFYYTAYKLGYLIKETII